MAYNFSHGETYKKAGQATFTQIKIRKESKNSLVIKVIATNIGMVMKCCILWFRQEETFREWSFIWARIVREEIITTRWEAAPPQWLKHGLEIGKSISKTLGDESDNGVYKGQI